jgi:lipoprotein NlpD
MNKKNNIVIIVIAILFSGCASKIPVPVDGQAVTTKEKGEKCPDIYKVKASETLFSISIMCGFNYKDVATANGLKKPYEIKKGDIIRLDLLRKSKAIPEQEPILLNEVETIPLDQGNKIIEESAIIGPVRVTDPKVIREIYTPKLLNKTNRIITKKEKLSNIWLNPTDGKITSKFDIASGAKGIEIEGQLGQEIRAVTKGKVIYAGEDLKGYGKLVIVKHDDGLLTIYGNQNEILVKESQIINAGETIGTMGKSATEQVKLIFEVRDGGKSIDPLKYLKNTIN